MNEADGNKTVEAATEPTFTEEPAMAADHVEQLFRQYNGLVYRTAYRVTGNTTDAEDVLQTVFLRLVRRGDPINDVSSMGSYLYRAAVNAALDLVKSRQRTTSLEPGGGAPGFLADTRQSPERVHFSAQVRKWLRTAVAGLSPMASEAFVLRFFEGKSNIEIAGMLKTTPSTVGVTLHRARERLQEEFRTNLGGFR